MLSNMKILNAIFDEIIYGVGNHNHYMLNGLWFSLFDIDRDEYVGSDKKHKIRVNSKDVELDYVKIDELIEERIYKLRGMIYKSQKAFNNSMILFEDDDEDK